MGLTICSSHKYITISGFVLRRRARQQTSALVPPSASLGHERGDEDRGTGAVCDGVREVRHQQRSSRQTHQGVHGQEVRRLMARSRGRRIRLRDHARDQKPSLYVFWRHHGHLRLEMFLVVRFTNILLR